MLAVDRTGRIEHSATVILTVAEPLPVVPQPVATAAPAQGSTGSSTPESTPAPATSSTGKGQDNGQDKAPKSKKPKKGQG